MNTPVKSMPTAEEHLILLGEMLGRAFFDDPLHAYIYPDLEERRNRLKQDFEYMARYGHLFGQVFTTPELTGCSIWLPPGETAFLPEREAQISLSSPATPPGKDTWKRWDNFIGTIQRIHPQVMPDPHWYLVVVGVEPARQGHGIGSAVLAPMLARADQVHLTCYLETVNERNLSFYEKNGFEVITQADLKGGGYRVWFLVRKPRTNSWPSNRTLFSEGTV